MTDCCCGNPEGTNKECERCRLIADITRLDYEVLRLSLLLSEVANSGIEYTANGKYHCLQVSCSLWDEIREWGEEDSEEDYVSPEDQKRDDAMERGDEMRDRAKDERAE